MKHLATLLLIFGFGLSSFGQTIKSLGYNTTNGQVVANTGTNVLTFTNSDVQFSTINSGYVGASWFFVTDGGDAIQFETETVAAATRANLGFSTNLNTLWTSTNASGARTNLGLGATWLTNMAGGVGSAIIGSGPNNTVSGGNGNFSVIVGGRDNAVTGGLSVVLGGRSNEVTANYSIAAGTAAKAVHSGAFVFADYRALTLELIPFSSTNDNSFNVRAAGGMSLDLGTNGIIFRTNASAAATRTNLGLGGGITATNTFVSYNGTNYTTNTVTISNGIITGWTQ